jgi:ATP-dependent protease ClpP protease subunit
LDILALACYAAYHAAKVFRDCQTKDDRKDRGGSWFKGHSPCSSTETVSFFGLPIMRYIDINDSEAVISAINMTDKDVPIDIILHTPGGLVLAALQIAMAIKKHPAKTTAFVPYYAMNGGTSYRPCLR